MNRDALSFWQALWRSPRKVAALAPSGQDLARLITSEIGPASGPIIELGPGTGVFTRVLIAKGVAEADLTLIEHEADFACALSRRFPSARILQMDAARLRSVSLGVEAGAAVSGLPLLSMSPRSVVAVLHGAFLLLRPGAAFYQFTYSFRCPVPRPILDRLGLKAARIGGTFANLPPAAVYRITRRVPRTRFVGRAFATGETNEG